MAGNRGLMAALVAILVTTTSVRAADEGWQEKLRSVAYTRIAISGALAGATIGPAMAPSLWESSRSPLQVRSSSDEPLQGDTPCISPCQTRLSRCLTLKMYE